ncbi:MAG: leucyl aminopeptidase family protein [Ancalomicrobiaceae bacterium]|nr:leucyl aminopeptidase family protein [Ancalomicrobiaceae bacterium]
MPVHAVTPETLAASLEALGAPAAAFVRASGFKAKVGEHIVVPGPDGIQAVLFGVPASEPQGLVFGKLPSVLPAGDYRLGEGIADRRLAALGWGLGAYRFFRYKAAPDGARLRLDADTNRAGLERLVGAVTLARDLVNTPANDLGPAELASAVRAALEPDGATVTETVGADLLPGFPLIHAVGTGSERAPRLIEATWGNAGDPKVTLVGKGVVFDTGGLDIKSDTGMLLMKKDMGGAANVLALAKLIIGAGLPVRLRVLIPAVENAISGRAFRPSDIYPSRKGITVEIGNTDAEGRLVLADALAFADEEAPDLLIDMATLTGAARVALGPDLPPFYSRDDALAARLQALALALADPLWRMPLWAPYEAMLDSKVADVNNTASGGFAGSITAALFLSKFVEKAKAWVHLDIYAWNPSAKPGRPEGGEAQGIRALFDLIAERFGGAD